MASDKALSWVFAEEFVEENELLAQAREAATDLGADPVSTGVGATLRLLAATCGAKAVLEIGTGAGVSGLWLLQGMSPDGVLTTIDQEVEFHKHARRAFAAAGIASPPPPPPAPPPPAPPPHRRSRAGRPAPYGCPRLRHDGD